MAGTAFPDIFVVRLSQDRGNNLQPAICVAKAKRSQVGNRIGEGGPNYRAQIAAALHPTLVLLALYLTDKFPTHTSLDERGSYPETDPHFPDWLFLYGVYYDEKKVIFYAHIPIYSRRPKKTPKWSFNQVHIHSFNIAPMEDEEHREVMMRFRLAVAMLAVRRHNEKLVTELGAICSKYRRT